MTNGELARDAAWDWTAHLLDDVRQAVQSQGATKESAKKIKPHPQRPTGKKAKRKPDDLARQRALNEGRRRARERQAAIDRGEIA